MDSADDTRSCTPSASLTVPRLIGRLRETMERSKSGSLPQPPCTATKSRPTTLCKACLGFHSCNRTINETLLNSASSRSNYGYQIKLLIEKPTAPSKCPRLFDLLPIASSRASYCAYSNAIGVCTVPACNDLVVYRIRSLTRSQISYRLLAKSEPCFSGSTSLCRLPTE